MTEQSAARPIAHHKLIGHSPSDTKSCIFQPATQLLRRHPMIFLFIEPGVLRSGCVSDNPAQNSLRFSMLMLLVN